MWLISLAFLRLTACIMFLSFLTMQ
jgi:hypothetical protein